MYLQEYKRQYHSTQKRILGMTKMSYTAHILLFPVSLYHFYTQTFITRMVKNNFKLSDFVPASQMNKQINSDMLNAACYLNMMQLAS